MNYLSKEKLKQFKKLQNKKYRRQEKQFIVEGYHLVEEALKHNLLTTIITSNTNLKFNNFDNVLFAQQSEIEKLSQSKNPQDIIGICNFIDPQPIKNKLIVLNNINDPGNLGTIIRTAAAFNFTDVIVQGVDIYNDKVLRSTQGAIFNINVFNVDNLEGFLKDLKKEEYTLIGTLIDKEAISYKEYKFINESKYVIIFGNEANGIDESIKSIIDKAIYIPINFESLNVSVAAGIIMAEINWENK